MTSRAWGRGSVVGAAALLLLLAGCSSDEEGGGPQPADPTSSSTPSSPSATASASVPEPEPTAEPADGPLIRTEGATIRGLKGYRLVSDFGVVQGYRDDQSNMSFSPGYTDKPSLDAYARQEIQVSRNPKALQRVEDVVVGGQYNAFHLLDTSDPDLEGHVFGVMFLDGSWIIKINFYEYAVGKQPPLTAEERQQVMDSILATFEPTLA